MVTRRLFGSQKADLTEYLAASTLEYNKNSSKVVITSASEHAISNSVLLFEYNNHQAADTLLIDHAVLASRRHPHDAELVVFSQETGVLVLVIANYELLLRSTFLSIDGLRINPSTANMESSTSRKSKGFAGLTCIFGDR